MKKEAKDACCHEEKGFLSPFFKKESEVEL